MIDIETTGTDPSFNAMIQFAAVMFDYHTGAVGQTFCRNLSMVPGRFWDEDTRDWWSKNPAVFEKVAENPTHPHVALTEFKHWLFHVTGALREPKLWAKPISFESPFIASYFRQFGIENPFHYREAMDMQSFIRGLRGDPWAPAFDKEVPMVGDAHHALDDVFHQIRVLLTAKHRFGQHAQDQAAR